MNNNEFFTLETLGEFYVSQTQARTDPETGRTYPPQNRIANYVMPMLAVA